MTVRSAAVAGQFYSDKPDQLRQDVLHYLGQTRTSFMSDQIDPHHIKALIVPHAGYMYSGGVAASAYNVIAARKTQIKRVILLGPSHRVPLRKIALPDADTFETPLGTIPLDTETFQQLQTFADVEVNATAHQFEHSLEVQLPFLQSVLDDFLLVPLVVGHVSAESVEHILRPFLDSPENLIVISTDLSHFHPYDEAREIDTHTSELIEAKFYNLDGEQACGCNPLNGLLKLAADKNLNVTTIDQCTSGDTAGNKDQVVGYGAYLVY